MLPTDAVRTLIAKGETEESIAAKAFSSQPTINRLKHGRQNVGYELGRRLVDWASTGVQPKRLKKAKT